MAVSSEILFAGVLNQLLVVEKSSSCGTNGINKNIFSNKLADFLLNYQCSLAVRRTLIQANFVSHLFTFQCHIAIISLMMLITGTESVFVT